MGIQICEILNAIHSLTPPIICRDIKPSNIMIQNDKYYLIDFNIARIFDANLKQDTQLLGTENFAAPEQYGFAQTDERSDLYSLAVTMNILSTGKTPMEKLASGELGKTIKYSTQIDPNNRYQSAIEFSNALRNIPSQNQSVSFIQSIKMRFKKPQTIIAIIFYALLIFLLSKTTHYNAVGKPFTCKEQLGISLFIFFMLFIPYFYNANYFHLLNRTLKKYQRNRKKYWFMRILYTFLFSIIPMMIVLIALI